MKGYDELNAILGSLRETPQDRISPSSNPGMDIPAEQFEDPLNPVPIPDMDFEPANLPGMMVFLDMSETIDMSNPAGADQLSLHVLMLTMTFKDVLARLEALEAKLRELEDR